MSTAAQHNSEQQRAVTSAAGPILIVAGPGTGKTRTLTARIAHLLKSGVAADDILALTFTNKAAKEMRERLATTMGAEEKLPIITTFHALAQRLLPANNERRIVPEPERHALLQEIKKSYKTELSARDLGLLISKAKNKLGDVDATVQPLLATYDEALAAHDLRDFDDLLLDLHAALQDPATRQQHTVMHVLVDEFQDTNDIQYAITTLLSAARNIFVIGDPLQSIYGFRGASAAVFDRFRAEFPEATEIRLTTNYRSRPEIVRATYALFPDVPSLLAHRQESGKTCAVQMLNEYGEADWVVGEIERRIGGSTMLASSAHHADGEGRIFGDFAILYRTHAVARIVQRALEASGLPYQVAGEGSPYEQPKVRTILRALHYLATGEASDIPGLNVSQIRILLEPFRFAELALPELVEKIIELFALRAGDASDGLRQFCNSLVQRSEASLPDYLEYVQTIQEQAYYDPAADAITLSTIHAAKGLEFPCVFLLAAEEGIVPHIRTGKPTDLDGERRLLYVAMSRARDELYLLHAQKRNGRTAQLSSFIQALPTGIIAQTTDPHIPTQLQTIARRERKRSQTSLF